MGFLPVGRDVFHEKAVNSKLKFTSTFFDWVEVAWNGRVGYYHKRVAKTPRSPGGTGGAKSPEGI